MKKTSQTPNVFPSQSIEDYQENGPSRLEQSDDFHLVDGDTRFVLDFMKIKKEYNSLREEGVTHGEAWRKSQAYTLPIERQLLMKQEIEEKNPNFYNEASSSSKEGIKLMSKSVKDTHRSCKESLRSDFVYTEEDLKRIESEQNQTHAQLAVSLKQAGFSDDEIEDMI